MNYLEDECFVKRFKKTILENSPTGIIFVNPEGVIEYVNNAVGYILGSTKTVGLNILEFDTVRNSRLFSAILGGFQGITANIKRERYISYTNRQEKYLNFYIIPDINEELHNVEGVILIIHDLTEEIRLKEQVEKSYVNTIEVMARLVDARDSYTWEHSENVSGYVAQICERLTIDKEEKERIILSAKFHDIGKVGISDLILNKDGKLTDEEYAVMKTHPTIGADIVKNIHGFDEVSQIIKHHHERWDGKGYPSNLKGDEIPFGSQIIAIADTFDAITSDRVYRKSKGKEKAIKILKEEKGRQFNSELVDTFLSVIENS